MSVGLSYLKVRPVLAEPLLNEAESVIGFVPQGAMAKQPAPSAMVSSGAGSIGVMIRM